MSVAYIRPPPQLPYTSTHACPGREHQRNDINHVLSVMRICRRRRASYAEHLETRATIRTAIIVAVLCGTWLGFFSIYVIDGWCTSCRVPRRLYAFFFWLGYVNSAVNPILYTVFKAEFRRAFRQLICRRRCCCWSAPPDEDLDGRRRPGRGFSAPSLQSWRPATTVQLQHF